MANEKKWLTVRETAERLGVPEVKVRRMIQAAELPASREHTGSRAPWLVDGEALERQLEEDRELEERRQRLAGVVVGRGEEFFRKVEQKHGPAVARQLREIHARHEALYEAAQAVDQASDEYRAEFAELDEQQAIEEAARRRADWVRREERIRQRALELLEDDEGE